MGLGGGRKGKKPDGSYFFTCGDKALVMTMPLTYYRDSRTGSLLITRSEGDRCCMLARRRTGWE